MKLSATLQELADVFAAPAGRPALKSAQSWQKVLFAIRFQLVSCTTHEQPVLPTCAYKGLKVPGCHLNSPLTQEFAGKLPADR